MFQSRFIFRKLITIPIPLREKNQPRPRIPIPNCLHIYHSRYRRQRHIARIVASAGAAVAIAAVEERDERIAVVEHVVGIQCHLKTAPYPGTDQSAEARIHETLGGRIARSICRDHSNVALCVAGNPKR